VNGQKAKLVFFALCTQVAAVVFLTISVGIILLE